MAGLQTVKALRFPSKCWSCKPPRTKKSVQLQNASVTQQLTCRSVDRVSLRGVHCKPRSFTEQNKTFFHKQGDFKTRPYSKVSGAMWSPHQIKKKYFRFTQWHLYCPHKHYRSIMVAVDPNKIMEFSTPGVGASMCAVRLQLLVWRNTQITSRQEKGPALEEMQAPIMFHELKHYLQQI